MIIMVLILIAYLLSGFGLSAFCAECSVPVYLDSVRCRYQNKKYVDYCNDHGIKCSYNTIFVSGLRSDWDSCSTSNDKKKIPDELKKIKHLPVELFIGSIRKDATIATIKNEDGSPIFKIVAGYNIRIVREHIEECVKKYPFPYAFSSDDEKKEFENTREELIKNGILATVGGVLAHGPNGCFGPEEYNKTVREYRKGMFFYYLPRLLCSAGFLFGGYYLLSEYSK